MNAQIGKPVLKYVRIPLVTSPAPVLMVTEKRAIPVLLKKAK